MAFFLRTVVPLLISLVSVWSFAAQVKAQPVLTPVTVSMGGGSGYVTGPAANFYNPANLMIRDRPAHSHIIAGQGGFYLSEGIAVQNLNRDYRNFERYFTEFDAIETSPGASEAATLSRRFPDGQDVFTNSAQYDIIPFGISILRGQHAFSVVLRTRSTNSWEMNRGWFDASRRADEDSGMLERSLRQNFKTYHELSVGLAREVTMVNGWMTGANTLYFGIAPKLIMAGNYFDGHYMDSFYHEAEAESMQDAGRFKAGTEDSGSLYHAAFTRHSDSGAEGAGEERFPFMEASGWGAGLDAGFTFVMNLGRNRSVSAEPDRKSIRFSLSMTDIGFVTYGESPVISHSAVDTLGTSDYPGTVHLYVFNGQIGEFTHFIDKHSDRHMQGETVTREKEPFNDRLPSALHFGTVFKYNNFLAAVDLEYQQNPLRYDMKGLHTRVGTEINILGFLPVRSGLSFSPAMKPILGLGLGIDAGFWELSVAGQIKQGYDDEAYAVGLALTALQFRF